MPMMKISTLNYLVSTYQFVFGKAEYSTVKYYTNEVYKAPDKCIENILNFARTYKVEETRATGKIELILN